MKTREAQPSPSPTNKTHFTPAVKTTPSEYKSVSAKFPWTCEQIPFETLVASYQPIVSPLEPNGSELNGLSSHVVMAPLAASARAWSAWKV